MELRIQALLNDAQCYDQLREMRWPEGRTCPHCEGKRVVRRGFDERQPARQRYECKDCGRRFDDLTGTIFAGHHQPLKMWMLVLYLMGLNISNSQIAQELGLNRSDVQKMTDLLREGIRVKKNVQLKGEVELDEVYVVAGHKGQPERVSRAGRAPRRRRLKGSRGRGTAESDKPPILGMIERGGQIALFVLIT